MKEFISKFKKNDFVNKLFIGLFILILIFLKPNLTIASGLLDDIDLKLEIEIGDSKKDFNDEGKTFEKARFLTYKITVKNNGAEVYNNLYLLMDAPVYTNYVAGSTKSESLSDEVLDDENSISLLEKAYKISTLGPSEEIIFTTQYQAQRDILDDTVETLAWASISSLYNSMPHFSNIVKNTISGEPKPLVQVSVKSSPDEGSQVFPRQRIVYTYNLHNVGGDPANNVEFLTYLPNTSSCVSGCGITDNLNIEPNSEEIVNMTIEVNEDVGTIKEIVNRGYDLSGTNLDSISNKDKIIHYIDPSATTGEQFIVDIKQVPNLVLNSADEKPRADNADITETKYTLTHKGTHMSPMYPQLSDNKGYIFNKDSPCSKRYSLKEGTYTYAYNSTNISNCTATFNRECNNLILGYYPINFSVSTSLPNHAPKLEFIKNIPYYEYGNSVNAIGSYMSTGGAINVPSITKARGVEDGAMGVVSTKVSAVVSEDKWVYTHVRDWKCGHKKMPIYNWIKESRIISLSNTAETDITVFTSTAWLKTEKGNIATNNEFTNSVYTDANYVNLGVTGFTDFLTPSENYTPIGEFNADAMIFSNRGTGAFKTKAGDAWKVTGTKWQSSGSETPYLQKGEVYDRLNNPRDYYKDMFLHQKFGPVKENELNSHLEGDLYLEDGVIYKNSGDIIIGKEGVDDVLTLDGGRARIYTDGDVYINANIKYKNSSFNSYTNITSVRIDARNVYISGEVEDLEVMILARNTFMSGISQKQLRILGDVIAGSAIWQRKPLNEISPTEVNKPSEYLIEDMRKYVAPAPGDEEIPDDYNVWRQVNPATGEVYESY